VTARNSTGLKKNFRHPAASRPQLPPDSAIRVLIRTVKILLALGLAVPMHIHASADEVIE
jgi:hypothetical protein